MPESLHETRQIRVRVEGHVQGVFFRATTEKVARSLGLAGWVKNRADGTVEAAFEGDDHAIGAILGFCLDGPERARVSRLVVEPSSEPELPTPFTVRR